ncbi:MAG: ribbon-helix-helix protein, CopG family [Candidatus Paceibacter sp.]|nr:ribbon-helix-helix protein, CopG family [Candidatus Paceibacter sp.]
MRSVINISLPKSMADLVEKEVKSGKFATKSEFIRHAIRAWNTHKLAKELKEAKKEFEAGKGKVLRSLHDLR